MKIHQTVFSFTRDELEALVTYAGDDAKPEHAFVVLDPANRRAYATNHERLAMVHAFEASMGPEGEPSAPVALARAGVEAALEPRMGKGSMILVTLAGELRLVDSSGKVIAEKAAKAMVLDDAARLRNVDYAYPFFGLPPPPLTRTCPLFGINARYLADLSYVTSAAGESRIDLYPGETIYDPILFHVGEAWQVVIMPCLIDKPKRRKKAA